MSARCYNGELAELDEFGDSSDEDQSTTENGTHLDVEEIAPSLAPKPKTTVPALITKHIAKVTFTAMGIVLALAFIRAIRYPRIRTEWEFRNPIIRMREGVPVVYERITSPIPCIPENATERWAAYNDYKDVSLKRNELKESWGKSPDCSSSDSLLEPDPACWVMAPSDGCSSQVTWQDLHDQRNEAFQQAEGAEVQRVYPSSPAGEISTNIKLAKGTRKTYSCTTVTARNRYADAEEWGQWEEISNCSYTKVNGTKAIELRTERKELSLEGESATKKVTLLTEWPTSPKRELQALFDFVLPVKENSSTPRTQRSLPAYAAPPVTDQAGGCPHKTSEKWFQWTVGVTKPGRKIKSYPPGLQWIKSQQLAGKKTLYFMETPVLSTDQVERIEGLWGSKVVDAVLSCIATKLDPLDLPWRDLSLEDVTKRRVRNSGEMVPICRSATHLGMPALKWTQVNGTKGWPSSCKIPFRNYLRRFRVTVDAKADKGKPNPRTSWKNYVGLGLTHYEVQLIDTCWTKPGPTEDDRLRMFLHQQLAAQILGFQLHYNRRHPPKSHPQVYPGSFVVAIGENNKDPPAETRADPNVYSDGTDKPIKEWVLNWKEKFPQIPFTHFDVNNYLKGEITLPPPLILTKRTETGYILRWGMEPTFQATGAQLGAYPQTTYGIRGKQYCTPEDQSQCTTRDTHPATHVDEATSAMVDLASTRTLTHVTEGNGLNVTWINWGSLTREQADEIGCDVKRMVARYYIVRNPPPQEHAWNNMHWYDSPVVRDTRDLNRWRAVTGDPGNWFFNPAYPRELGAPTILLNCYRATPTSTLGQLQDSATYGKTTLKCGALYSLSEHWMEKGFPYYWPPEAYLLNRWSFANTQYCNNNGKGNCNCHGTCGQEGWVGSVYEPCSTQSFDFGTPWPSPSDYLVTGSSLTPGIGWTARGFTLQAVFPKTHFVNMTRGSCLPDYWARDKLPSSTGWNGFTLFGWALTTTIGHAATDIGESVKAEVTEVYEVVTSWVQTSWNIISGILKWAIPCMMLLGLAILISVLYRLGLLGGLGRSLKHVLGWVWGRRNSSPREGLRPKGPV